jgi:hypothetical protein
MKIHFKPQMSQINADEDVAGRSNLIMFLSSNHLRTSASSAVNLLHPEGEE